MAVQTRTLLDVATRVLVADPAASLGDVASAAGVSRTTLHSRFPTRHALLVALAEEALTLVEQALADSGIEAADCEDVRAALGRVVALTLPLGPRVEFLLRERSLDIEPELKARYAALDRPLIAFMNRASARGRLRADVPTWWMAASLWGAVTVAWEAIADGRLAPRDAPELVLTTVLSGVAPGTAQTKPTPPPPHRPRQEA